MVITSVALTTSCSEESIGRVNYDQTASARMDLTGAVSIGVSQGKSQTRAIDGEYLSAGMYKIDANGDIHAVAVYFSDKSQHEEIVRVAPHGLESITENYMIAVECDYYDSDNDLIQDLWIDDGEDDVKIIKKDIPYKNLLIRKSDGKIWCIDNIISLVSTKKS